MDISALSLQEKKRLMRSEMRALRNSLSKKNTISSNKLRDIFRAHVQLPSSAIVASYSAFRGEIDPAPLCEDLRHQGHKIALPVINEKRAPLAFHLYEKGDKLKANHMGILQPDTTKSGVSPAIDPDVLLVPLLAFDHNRYRLGYGGGYYDRTIEALRSRKSILTIGIAYACQEVKDVPVGSHDIRLDKIVTELNIF